MSTFESSDPDIFSFFEMTPDLVCVAGRDGFFRKVNRAVISKLEYPVEELFARPISSFIFPEDAMITQQTREAMLNGNALINFENRYVSKSGNIIWLHWTSFYIPDKDVVFAIAKDVTHKKLVEQEMNEKYNRFKGIADHFKKNIEKDRKYFAGELHEQLAQLASVIKMNLDSMSQNMEGINDFLKERIEHASMVSELMIKTIRKISFDVSPHMLDDLGLNDTLKWLCNDFSVINNITCVFESDYEENDLSREVQIDFFRICQDALKNVLNHANAGSVKVSICHTSDSVCLTIEDDGNGFDTQNYIHGSGFANIQDRTTSINGSLAIKSSAGTGTTVSVTVHKPNQII